MSRPSLGKYVDGGDAVIDLPRLLETRMLIQAASGFGKSYAVRRLLEQTAGQVQQLVIDPDGEYATLREKHDFIIAAAHDGDALAHPKTAALLARRLLETGVSAILDIYDLKPHERHAFVRIFLQSLVDAPKNLWHPVLVVVDEAHIYSPQVGESEAAGAVIDLATRGRKRGFGIVLATQRLSKLHKDAAAECLNKLIGRAGLDVDLKRAADDLGMTYRDAAEQLKKLDPGEFFTYGPAIWPDVRRVKIGDVRTTHPKAGERSLAPPPKPTAAIKAVLPQLADLPKEAEQEARSLEDLKRELTTARRELTLAKSARPGPSTEDLKAAEARGRTQGYDSAIKAHVTYVDRVEAWHERFPKPESTRLPAPPLTPVTPRPAIGKPAASVQRPAPSSGNGSSDLGRCEQKILSVLSQFPEGCEVGKLTLLTGYRLSGGFRNSLSALRTAGLIEGENTGVMRITDDGLGHGPFPQMPEGDALLQYWVTHSSFGACERKILQALAAAPDGMTVDDLCAATEYQLSGGFRNSLSALRTAGVLVGKNTGTMRLSREILP